MKRCERCQEIIEKKAYKMRRKDGSSVMVCGNCVAELRAKFSQKTTPPSLEPVAEPLPEPMPMPEAKPKSKNTWYKTIGFGVFCIFFAGLTYFQLTQLEIGTVSSVRVWLPVAIMYRVLGFWGAVSCPGILALLLLGVGVKELIEADGAF